MIRQLLLWFQLKQAATSSMGLRYVFSRNSEAGKAMAMILCVMQVRSSSSPSQVVVFLGPATTFLTRLNIRSYLNNKQESTIQQPLLQFNPLVLSGIHHQNRKFNSLLFTAIYRDWFLDSLNYSSSANTNRDRLFSNCYSALWRWVRKMESSSRKESILDLEREFLALFSLGQNESFFSYVARSSIFCFSRLQSSYLSRSRNPLVQFLRKLLVLWKDGKKVTPSISFCFFYYWYFCILSYFRFLSSSPLLLTCSNIFLSSSLPTLGLLGGCWLFLRYMLVLLQLSPFSCCLSWQSCCSSLMHFLSTYLITQDYFF